MTSETSATATATEHTERRHEHAERSPSSPEGIGDIVLAGHPAPYPHLQTRSAPTIGRLAAAARAAASALARPVLRPRLRGRWQPAPRAVRRAVSGRMRVSTLVLEPNGFAAVPAPGPRDAAVLHVAHGRVHMVTIAPDHRMQAVQELTGERARVLGSGDGHQLINTGGEPAVVVRITG
ncbi:hypothetical protein LP52_18585 [Streptomonospora alba]|uniref:Cupin 2 conserved barrel domain-containing protein n=1 Tax=Streptomonospora alba TaxID=183763 RepID=A0A0C2FEA3_9ACTN|nr:hypothetical protein [Streptomonospora alba]KIH97544.1 hypothetical protein LP52_18585 [Streptomonospora alba]